MNRTGDLDEDQRSTRGTGWQKKLLASGYLQVGFASLMASMVGPLVKIIDLPVTVIAFGRFLFAWLALLAGRALWGRAASNEAQGFRRTLILIGCNTAATLLCFMAAFRFVPVTNAVLLAFSYPVIAAFLAHRFLGERILGVALGALVLSAAGAALITLPEAGGAQIGAWWGMGLAFASAWFAAIEVILIKKIAGSVSSETVNLYRFGTAAVLTLPLIWTSRWHVTGRDAFLVIMLGVLNTALSGTIYVAGLRKAQAHRAAILSYLEPVGAMALAWVFLSEQPTLTTLLGGGLILTGSYLVVRGEVVTV